MCDAHEEVGEQAAQLVLPDRLSEGDRLLLVAAHRQVVQCRDALASARDAFQHARGAWEFTHQALLIKRYKLTGQDTVNLESGAITRASR